ncbi:MAG: hypothetical protein P1P84_02615 [Deferrisomatales bacterium]|nr:hypothetical protein [Deferrisomatales bacterium]
MAEQRTLTDADIHAIAAAISPQHACRFSISQEEFDHTWPAMVGLAKSMDQARSVSTKLAVTAVILFLFSAIGRGLWVWLGDVHTQLPR